MHKLKTRKTLMTVYPNSEANASQRLTGFTWLSPVSSMAPVALALVVAVLALSITIVENRVDASETMSAEALASKVDEILAIEADPAFGEYLGSECLTCHQPGITSETIPVVHGREAAEIIAALLEYKHEIRENTTMINMAKNLGDDEIAALATYFANQ